MNGRLSKIFVLAIVISCVAAKYSAADLLPTNAKILDDDLLIWIRPTPLISPDGKWVAYMSRGFVCACNLQEGKPRRLYEVPDCITHLMAQPEHTPPDGDYDKLSSELFRQAKSSVERLHWSHDSTGVAVSIVTQNEVEKKSVTRVVYLPLIGEPEQLGLVERHYESGDHFTPYFHLSRDRRYLVFERHKSPLIWDTKANKPRATGFLKLVPSSTSDRWFGIEKDTRQFIIVDKDFAVIERIEEYLPTRSWGLELIWSPDERFIIWKNKIGYDHYSNWEGCRLDLKTNKRRILTGSYMKEIVEFTGRDGEFIRCGTEGVQLGWSGLANRRSYLNIVPDGDGFPERIYSINADPNNIDTRRYLFASPEPLRWSSDYALFLLATGRPSGPYGCVWHLVNRERDRWRLSDIDNGGFESPFSIVGFAEDDTIIVGYDKKCLFAFPTHDVYNNEKTKK